MKILIPLDGSEHALEAVHHVIGLAREGLRTSVVLANVQERTHLYELMLTDAATVERASLDAGADALKGGAARLAAVGIPFEREVAIGEPVNTLVDILERHGCEAIVIGARGLGALRSAWLGSVSHALLNAANVPVTIVKRSEPEAELVDEDTDTGEEPLP